MKIWLGKHYGQDLCDIPLSYLKWLEEQEDIDVKLRQALQFEIERREGDRPGIGKTIKPPNK